MWQQPKTNWDTHPKAIEPADLNRIEGNILAVREQSDLPFKLEIVSALPSAAGNQGRAVFYNGRAYVCDGTNWTDISGVIGDAAAANVLAGKVFSSESAGVGITGTMPNRTGHVTAQGSSVSGTTLRFRPQEGYYPGNAANSVQLSDANFVAANIKSGVNIFGVQGAFPIGGLISLQRGSGILSAETNNIAINSVDLNKTFVIFHGSGGTTFYSAVGPMNYATAKLTSSTNLQIQRQYNSSHSGNILYTYFVIEMNGISVQSGETDVPHDATSHNVTINSVDVNKSFPLFTLRSTATRETPPFYMYNAQLTSSTNLNFAKQFASDVTYDFHFDTIAWFVVTFDF
jgi:hypothetical protein